MTRRRDSGGQGARAAVVTVSLLLGLLLGAGAEVWAARAWTLDIVASVEIEPGNVRVADIVAAPVPERVATTVLYAGGLPGRTVTLEARGILRRLSALGLAAGLRMRGAPACRVTFTGRETTPAELAAAIEEAVAPLLPTPETGAPVAWIEITVPDRPLPLRADWRAELGAARPLVPGRNLVPVAIVSGDRTHRFSVEVKLHAFAELPRPKQVLAADTPLRPEHFDWEWIDLCELAPGLAVGREAIAGASAGRDLAAGQPIRRSELHATPLVHSGDRVELRIRRGRVMVAVRAVARRSGALGQDIPVRNELTGRVVTARVVASGIVDWRP